MQQHVMDQSHSGHGMRDRHAEPVEHGDMNGHMGNLKQTFFVSLLLALPIMALSSMMGISLPFQVYFPGSDYVVLILATILFFYGGRPFLQGAANELQARKPAMMTLISLGIGVAYLYSVYAVIMNQMLPVEQHVMDFFWELATLIVIMLLGHWLEMRAIHNAGNALERMAALLPATADVVQEDGKTRETPLQHVQQGERVLVRAGQSVPVDGIVLQGSGSVNESLVTGESVPVRKTPGDTVIGGSMNGSGTLTVEVTGTGESGYLAQVMQLVDTASRSTSHVETLADKVAGWLFYVAVVVGVLAFAAWFAYSMDMNTALARMVTVLIIACPHALGLAIPLVAARATSLGARQGLLFRNKQAFENADKVDMIMLDKTGTLTEGTFSVARVESLSDRSDEDVLRLAGSLERNSTHPLAVGILREAEKRSIELPQSQGVVNLPGKGVEGTIDGTRYSLVSETWLREHTIEYDAERLHAATSGGASVSVLVADRTALGFIAQSDQPKQGASELLRALADRHIAPMMLTGDNEAAAKTVAEGLGLTQYRASLTPEAKEALVRNFRYRGRTVMMVGDGINDAPALVRANVGVAVGAGTDVAMAAADVVLMHSRPQDIIRLLDLSHNTSKKMRQNLWWGAGYNIVAIPLAAGVLAPFGIVLSPAAGAVLMSLSTIIVALNAMSLKEDTITAGEDVSGHGQAQVLHGT